MSDEDLHQALALDQDVLLRFQLPLPHGAPFRFDGLFDIDNPISCNLVPMAGLGLRFLDCAIPTPKYRMIIFSNPLI